MTRVIGFSQPAEILMERMRKMEELYCPTFLQEHPNLIDQVWDAYDLSQRENTDGESKPVSKEIVDTAFLFLESLPIDFPAPDVSPEQDGNLALVWELEPSWTLFLSIGPNARCFWAALFGNEEIRGAFTFYGVLPQSLSVAISRFK